MLLLLCSMATGQDQVQLEIQDSDLRPIPQGLRLDIEGGTAGNIGVGVNLRATNWGGVGPSWLYTSASASVALWRPALVGNEMGYRLPMLVSEARVGLVRSKVSEGERSLEVGRSLSGGETEITYAQYSVPAWNHIGIYGALGYSQGDMASVVPGIGLLQGSGVGARVEAPESGSVAPATGMTKALTLYAAPSRIEGIPIIPGLMWERTKWSANANNHSRGRVGTLGVGVIPTRMRDEDIETSDNISYVPMPTLRLSVGWTGGIRI